MFLSTMHQNREYLKKFYCSLSQKASPTNFIIPCGLKMKIHSTSIL